MSGVYLKNPQMNHCQTSPWAATQKEPPTVADTQVTKGTTWTASSAVLSTAIYLMR